MKEEKDGGGAGLIPLLIAALLCPLLLLFLIVGTAGGGTMAEPVIPFMTQEKAETYQYVGSELGIPWDITALVDAIRASEERQGNIEDENPLLTALEFCNLVELRYEWVEDEAEEGEEETQPGGHWEYAGQETYTACDAILSYIGAGRDDFAYTEASALVTALQEQAEKKSDSTRKFEITLTANSDYTAVLRDYIGLKEGDIDDVLALYDAHYLAYVYGYITDEDAGIIEDSTVDVPYIDPENGVTREELARVAASLMNWPYLLGGKSAAVGKPTGPLDCSGYVDWVYIQCFGAGISAGGGRIPGGVAVSGTAIQYYSCDAISESELKVGDLGFMKEPRDVQAGGYNHVGIYVGEIDGQHAWIHCGGSSFGYDDRPRGRVGISKSSGSNSKNNILGGTFSPPMKGCNFRYFRRPRFVFLDDEEEGEEVSMSWERQERYAA